VRFAVEAGSYGIRAADLDKVNLAPGEAHSCEIRAADLVSFNLAELALPYEIRAADLVKADIDLAEVGS
jgi:hypothetical protein